MSTKAKRTKAATKRSAPVLADIGRTLLRRIAYASDAIGNVTPTHNGTLINEINDLATAFSYFSPETPTQALAHACMAWADLEDLITEDALAERERLLAVQLKRRLWLIAYWIEIEHGISRLDFNLDHFSSFSIAHADVTGSNARLKGDLDLENLTRKERRESGALAAARADG